MQFLSVNKGRGTSVWSLEFREYPRIACEVLIVLSRINGRELANQCKVVGSEAFSRTYFRLFRMFSGVATGVIDRKLVTSHSLYLAENVSVDTVS